MAPKTSAVCSAVGVGSRAEFVPTLVAGSTWTLADTVSTLATHGVDSDPRVEHFRQLGMIWAFEVREDIAGPRFAERFRLAGREHELLIRSIGRTVYLLPPYVLEDTLSRWLGERVLATLDAVTTAGGSHADPAPEPATA